MTRFGPIIEPTTSPRPGGCATSYATDADMMVLALEPRFLKGIRADHNSDGFFKAAPADGDFYASPARGGI